MFAPVVLIATESAPIVITGQGLRPGETNGASIVTIDKDRIAQSASGRLEDVLRDVAGLQSFRRSDSRSSHATNQSITLRGLGGNASSRALLLVDGVPQADPFGGWISFPAYSTDRIGLIRVTRGGGSGYYGPGALAGTVEIESAVPTEGLSTLGGVAYGSRDSVDLRASVGAASDSRFWTISGAYARGDGFVPITSATRGPADRAAPYRQVSATARFVQTLGPTELQANVSAFFDRRDRGVAFTTNRGRGVDTSLRLVGKRWSLLGYAQNRSFASQFSSVNAGRTASTETLDQYSVPSRGYGFRAEAAPITGRFDVRVGIDGRFVRGQTNERYQFVAGSPTRLRQAGGSSATVGAFAVTTLNLGPTRLTGSVREDRWSISEGHLLQRTLAGSILDDVHFKDRRGWQTSGRLAAEYQMTRRTKLRAAAYRGWRLPTLNELYRPFRAGPDATGPNAALRPETMTGAEAGIDVSLAKSWTGSLTAFTARLHDAIANVTLGSGPGAFPIVGFVAAGGSYRQRQNIDQIRSSGVEADVAGRAGPFDLNFSYSFVDARVHASGAAFALQGKRPAQTPRHQVSATLAWNSKTGHLLSMTARALSGQFDDDLNQRRLKGVVTFDAFGSLPVTKRLAVEVRGENITNSLVQTALGSDGSVERASPRTFWLGLRLK
ncbi:TonB-dependent receptor [Sphingomonas flavescens]|uniref:TonB-dependent receptor n=1 Tax=Sphingomonas flavescens TaxID=3132797 RepID=UPI002806481C|nr:TonB-dependent receptor [Sphingomonas limnosediminicola]